MKLLQDVCVWPGLETMCGSGEAISAADVVCSNGDEQSTAIRGHTQPICRLVSPPHGPVCHVSDEPAANARTRRNNDNYTDFCHPSDYGRRMEESTKFFFHFVIVCVIAEWNEILC